LDDVVGERTQVGIVGAGPAGDPFENRLRLSHLRYITRSQAAAASLAENYAGLAGT
jgi:p-hydroxybenzoate 3-monooxygenase